MSRKDITDKQVCQAYLEYRKQKRLIYDPDKPHWPYDFLKLWTGEPEKVCEAAMVRAEKHGLVEYGVSLRSGWLTDRGRELVT